MNVLGTLLILWAANANSEAQVCGNCQSIRIQNLGPLTVNDGFSAVNEDYITEGELLFTGAGPSEVKLPNVQPNTTRRGPVITQPQPAGLCGAGQGAARQVCDLFNGFRRNNSLPEMFLDSRLNQVAEAYAQQMASTGRFDHRDEQGRGPSDRLSAAGIRWRGVAENIAQGQRSAEEVLNGWFESPGHQRNMVSPNYNRHGIGYHQGYWVHVFLQE